MIFYSYYMTDNSTFVKICDKIIHDYQVQDKKLTQFEQVNKATKQIETVMGFYNYLDDKNLKIKFENIIDILCARIKFHNHCSEYPIK